MFKKFPYLAIACALVLAGCSNGPSNTDSGVDDNSLEAMTAGIWIDGNGCDHWIIDDGVEGYMTPRVDPEGKPICRPGMIPFTTIDFHRSLMGLD